MAANQLHFKCECFHLHDWFAWDTDCCTNHHHWCKSHVTVWAPTHLSSQFVKNTEHRFPPHSQPFLTRKRLRAHTNHPKRAWVNVTLLSMLSSIFFLQFFPFNHQSINPHVSSPPCPLLQIPKWGESVVYPSLHSPDVLCMCLSVCLAIVTSVCPVFVVVLDHFLRQCWH